MLRLEPGFDSSDFGIEPAREIPVSMDCNAHLALLDDGMNLHIAKSAGVNSNLKLHSRALGRQMRTG